MMYGIIGLSWFCDMCNLLLFLVLFLVLSNFWLCLVGLKGCLLFWESLGLWFDYGLPIVSIVWCMYLLHMVRNYLCSMFLCFLIKSSNKGASKYVIVTILIVLVLYVNGYVCYIFCRPLVICSIVVFLLNIVTRVMSFLYSCWWRSTKLARNNSV